MAHLSLVGINKIYPNGFHAVHDFNLEIDRGEFIVFVGPSGCGKSTTLRLIAGLENISKGDFYIDGKRANDLGPRERGVAMVFQSYALYPQMTVYDNLAFGLTLQGVDEDVIDEKVQRAAKILGLTDYLDRMPRALSGGQRQRVAVGRAIIRKVEIFLMDEPLSNLDAKQRVTMRSEITQIHRETGATTIYVTHDQTEAMTMADRIVVMKDGYIQQIGTPQEVFNHPANLFVAGFIGMPVMNFFDAKLVREGMKYFVEVGGYRQELSAEKEERLYNKDVQSQDVTLGVRPEHTAIADKGIEAVIDVAEMMGSSVHLHVTAAGRDVIIIVPTADASVDYRIGDRVHFTFGGRVAHIFSKETDRNLEFD